MGDKVRSLNGETTQKASDGDDLLKGFILAQQPKPGTRLVALL